MATRITEVYETNGGLYYGKVGPDYYYIGQDRDIAHGSYCWDRDEVREFKSDCEDVRRASDFESIHLDTRAGRAKLLQPC